MNTRDGQKMPKTRDSQDFIDFANILKIYYGLDENRVLNQEDFVKLLFEKISNVNVDSEERISSDLGTYLYKRSIYPNVSTVLLSTLNKNKFRKWITNKSVSDDAVMELLKKLEGFIHERPRFDDADRKKLLKLCTLDAAGKFVAEIFINILSAPDGEQKIHTRYITDSGKKAVQYFVGRIDELNDIKTQLELDTPQAIWIHGMGGLGKTQLCRKLFYDLDGKFPFLGCLTFDGNFKQSIVSQVACKKDTSDLECAYQDTLKFINRHRAGLVLFIDNVTKGSLDAEELKKLHCHVIVTSRDAAPDTFSEKALGFLSLSECKKLFYSYYKKKKDDSVNEVIHRAGYLTLAVELLAKTARNIDISTAELLAKLIDKSFDLKTVVETNWDNDEAAQNKAVSVQFGIVFSFSGIKDDDKIYVLKNMAILPYLATRQKLLCEWLSLDEESSIFRQLYDSGWLQYSDEDGYLMHPIISYTVRAELSPLLNSCLKLIVSLIDAIERKRTKSIYEILEFAPYAQSIADYFIDNSKCIDDDNSRYMVSLCIQLASLFYENFDFNVAFHYGSASQSIAESMDNIEKCHLSQIYVLLASICIGIPSMGDEGLRYAELAMEYTDSPNENFEDSLTHQDAFSRSDIYIQLAASLGQQGKDLPRALMLANTALEICEELQPGPFRLGFIYRTMAFILRKSGDMNGACEYMERCIITMNALQNINPNHPDIANTYTVYAGFLLDINERLDDAITYLQESLVIRERNNPNDAFIAQNLHNIAVAYYRKSDYELAIEYLVLAIREALKNSESKYLETANLHLKLARIQYIIGDYESALISTQKSMDMKTTAIDKLNCHCHIAMCHYSNDNKDTAKQEIEKVVRFNKANNLDIARGMTFVDENTLQVECYIDSEWPYNHECDYAECVRIYKEITGIDLLTNNNFLL